MNPALFIGLLYQASSDKAVPNTNPTGALLSLTLGQGVAGKFTSREDSSLREKKPEHRNNQFGLYCSLSHQGSGSWTSHEVVFFYHTAMLSLQLSSL